MLMAQWPSYKVYLPRYYIKVIGHSIHTCMCTGVIRNTFIHFWGIFFKTVKIQVEVKIVSGCTYQC